MSKAFKKQLKVLFVENVTCFQRSAKAARTCVTTME
jgi:hypothetical protein